MKNTPTLLIASLLLSLTLCAVKVSFIPDACYSSHYNTFNAYIMNIDSSLKKEIKATFSNNDSQLTVNCGDKSDYLFTCKNTIEGTGSEGVYSLTKIEGKTADGTSKSFSLLDIKDPFCYSELCPSIDMSVQRINFANLSERAIKIFFFAPIPNENTIKVHAGSLEKYKEVPYCRKYSSTVLTCLLREEDTEYKATEELLNFKIEICPGMLNTIYVGASLKGKIPEGFVTDYDTWMKIPPSDESGIEVKFPSTNCFGSSIDATISNIPVELKNNVTAVFKSEASTLTVECGDETTEPMKCANTLKGTGEKGVYKLTELRAISKLGNEEKIPLVGINDPFCYSDLCPALSQEKQHVNFIKLMEKFMLAMKSAMD